MKRVVPILLSLILMFSVLLPITAFAATDTNADVVFVIDVSGSMRDKKNKDGKTIKGNDPKNLTAQTVSKYMDALGTNTNVLKNNIGIVTFGGDVVAKLDLTPHTEDTTILNFIDNHMSNDNRVQKETNVAKGVEEAVSMLENSKALKKAIIIVTDGELAFTGHPKDKCDEAKELLEDQVSTAVDKDIAVYSIQIEDGNKEVKDYERLDLQDIADRTNAKYKRASTADQIEKYVREFGSDLNPGKPYDPIIIDLEKGKPHTYAFEVEENVVSVSIQITHNDDFELLNVFDKDGNDIKGSKATVKERKGYTDIDIPNPEPGKITLNMMSDKAQRITIVPTPLVIYDIKSEPITKSLTTRKNFTANATVTVLGKEPDKDTLKDIYVEATLVNKEDKSLVYKFRMKSNGKGAFSLDDEDKARIKKSGDYDYTAFVYSTKGEKLAESKVFSPVTVKFSINPLIIILPLLAIIIAVVVIIIIINSKKLPKPFGKAQYTYTNYSTVPPEFDEFFVWDLTRKSANIGKAKTLSVYDLMKDTRPNLNMLSNIVFSVSGTKKAPKLMVANLNNDFNTSVSGLPLNETPTEFGLGAELRIESPDGQITIIANRIS